MKNFMKRLFLLSIILTPLTIQASNNKGLQDFSTLIAGAMCGDTRSELAIRACAGQGGDCRDFLPT